MRESALVLVDDDAQGLDEPGLSDPPPSPAHGEPSAQKDPLDLPVLVVNRFFQPVHVTTARRAFLLLFGGSALALDDTGELYDFSTWRRLPVRDKDDGLPIVDGELRVPRVLHLREGRVGEPRDGLPRLQPAQGLAHAGRGEHALDPAAFRAAMVHERADLDGSAGDLRGVGAVLEDGLSALGPRSIDRTSDRADR